MERFRVYDAVDSERDYQDRKWGVGSEHEIGTWLLYIEFYAAEARRRATLLDLSNPVNRDTVLADLRKITAVGVACMEQHGAPFRHIEYTGAVAERMERP